MPAFFLLVQIQSRFLISTSITASLNPWVSQLHFYFTQVSFRASRCLQLKSNISFLFWKTCHFHWMEFFPLPLLCGVGVGQYFYLPFLVCSVTDLSLHSSTRPVIAILPIWLFRPKKPTKNKNNKQQTNKQTKKQKQKTTKQT